MNIEEAELVFQQTALKLSKEKLHFHTIRFLAEKEVSQYIYSPHGSGVLIQIQDHYIIFTASHVTENMDDSSLYLNSST